MLADGSVNMAGFLASKRYTHEARAAPFISGRFLNFAICMIIPRLLRSEDMARGTLVRNPCCPCVRLIWLHHTEQLS